MPQSMARVIAAPSYRILTNNIQLNINFKANKIELQRDLSDVVRFVRFSGLDLSDLSDLPISAI